MWNAVLFLLERAESTPGESKVKTCPGCHSAIYDDAAKNGWCTDCNPNLKDAAVPVASESGCYEHPREDDAAAKFIRHGSIHDEQCAIVVGEYRLMLPEGSSRVDAVKMLRGKLDSIIAAEVAAATKGLEAEKDELLCRLRNLRDLYSVAAVTPAKDEVRFGRKEKETNV